MWLGRSAGVIVDEYLESRPEEEPCARLIGMLGFLGISVGASRLFLEPNPDDYRCVARITGADYALISPPQILQKSLPSYANAIAGLNLIDVCPQQSADLVFRRTDPPQEWRATMTVSRTQEGENIEFSYLDTEEPDWTHIKKFLRDSCDT